MVARVFWATSVSAHSSAQWSARNFLESAPRFSRYPRLGPMRPARGVQTDLAGGRGDVQVAGRRDAHLAGRRRRQGQPDDTINQLEIPVGVEAEAFTRALIPLVRDQRRHRRPQRARLAPDGVLRRPGHGLEHQARPQRARRRRGHGQRPRRERDRRPGAPGPVRSQRHVGDRQGARHDVPVRAQAHQRRTGGPRRERAQPQRARLRRRQRAPERPPIATQGDRHHATGTCG